MFNAEEILNYRSEIGWTTTKPTEPCVFVAATKTSNGWEHELFEFALVKDGGEEHLLLFSGNHRDYEWDDPADLTADKYLILPKHQ